MTKYKNNKGLWIWYICGRVKYNNRKPWYIYSFFYKGNWSQLYEVEAASYYRHPSAKYSQTRPLSVDNCTFPRVSDWCVDVMRDIFIQCVKTDVSSILQKWIIVGSSAPSHINLSILKISVDIWHIIHIFPIDIIIWFDLGLLMRVC